MLFPAVRHELSFWFGGTRLVGDLVLPPGAGPHPVVVVVQESGVTVRDYSVCLDGLAAAGLASFTWDRPAEPESRLDPLRRAADRAREVLTVVDRLHHRADLDLDAVALLGWGEGGWAAAKAATFCGQVRALVLVGTPMVTPARLLEHRASARLRAQGWVGADLHAALDVVRDQLARIGFEASGAPPSAVQARYLGAPWHPAVCALPELTEVLPADLDADPAPTLSAVGAPVLALYGEQDPLLPLPDSVRAVREALAAAGNADHQIAVVRGGDHALRVRPGHGLGRMTNGRHQFGEWPSGLTTLLADWLNGRLRPPVPGAAVAEPITTTRPPRAHAGPGVPVRQVRRRITC